MRSKIAYALISVLLKGIFPTCLLIILLFTSLSFLECENFELFILIFLVVFSVSIPFVDFRKSDFV